METHFNLVAKQLNYSQAELELIQKHKIIYILCRDEKEVERLTGYAARGMYNLAYDAIVTSYNVHYHELMHLMINYKLKYLNLFTHPFLLEGFATAFGGRGGLHSRVLMQMGSFLTISNFLDIEELFSYSGFAGNDPSLSYAASGVYAYFLINEIGIDSFLTIYKKYSGAFEDIRKMELDINELPSADKFYHFLAEFNFEFIKPERRNEKSLEIHRDSVNIIYEYMDKYYFVLSGSLLLKTESVVNNYKSKKFDEFNFGFEYLGERYLISANEAEISVYDLFTNNLILSCIQSFQKDLKPFIKTEDRYEFSIPKHFFIDVIFNRD